MCVSCAVQLSVQLASDTHVFTFVSYPTSRIDFRELVRDLFAIYKTRIWLQQVVPTGGKKVMVDYDS